MSYESPINGYISGGNNGLAGNSKPDLVLDRKMPPLGILCQDEPIDSKVTELQNRFDALRNLAIWMSGCGYDFTQSSYFMDNKHLLSNNTNLYYSDVPPDEYAISNEDIHHFKNTTRLTFKSATLCLLNYRTGDTRGTLVESVISEDYLGELRNTSTIYHGIDLSDATQYVNGFKLYKYAGIQGNDSIKGYIAFNLDTGINSFLTNYTTYHSITTFLAIPDSNGPRVPEGIDVSEVISKINTMLLPILKVFSSVGNLHKMYRMLGKIYKTCPYLYRPAVWDVVWDNNDMGITLYSSTITHFIFNIVDTGFKLDPNSDVHRISTAQYKTVIERFKYYNGDKI